MKAYSQDLRQRVLRAIDAGASQGEAAETFAVSVATIKRYDIVNLLIGAKLVLS